MIILNNETVGISAEIAIADEFGVEVSPYYRNRGDEEIALSIRNIVSEIFDANNIPYPITHIAENQSPIDFILENSKTLSVKSNKRRLGKVAPQVIGQPTNETYFDFLYSQFGYDINIELRNRGLCDSYENRVFLFKEFSLNNICEMLSEYWKHLFECDYYIHFFDVLDMRNNLTYNPSYIVIRDIPVTPHWDIENISFTHGIRTWNESNTVKYHGISIGEFQAHNNRNCLKFRFNIRGILKLLEDGLI